MITHAPAQRFIELICHSCHWQPTSMRGVQAGPAQRFERLKLGSRRTPRSREKLAEAMALETQLAASFPRPGPLPRRSGRECSRRQRASRGRRGRLFVTDPGRREPQTLKRSPIRTGAASTAPICTRCVWRRRRQRLRNRRSSLSTDADSLESSGSSLSGYSNSASDEVIVAARRTQRVSSSRSEVAKMRSR